MQEPTCTQPVIATPYARRPCGQLKAHPIHPEGAYRFEGGEVGDHIPHEFREDDPNA